jgi:hypothetical protein
MILERVRRSLAVKIRLPFEELANFAMSCCISTLPKSGDHWSRQHRNSARGSDSPNTLSRDNL